MTVPRASILLADSQDITRTTLATLLTGENYRVLQVKDGKSGLKVIQDTAIDLVIFDPQMSTADGYEIPRYIHGLGLKIPCVVMTAEQTSDLLAYTRTLGIQHILTKPVDPKRLTSLVEQIFSRLARAKPGVAILQLANDQTPLSPDQLMRHAVELAHKNFTGGFGSPFAAVVADPNGYILGSGANQKASRFDPFAHAEVMAIRQAIQTWQQPHLEGCAIYSTSEPTRMGRALIDSVGLKELYFGLRSSEVTQILKESGSDSETHNGPHLDIHILGADDVRAMLAKVVKQKQP
jgi:tRNA(Arg) A34 adenosine deaminase TadA